MIGLLIVSMCLALMLALFLFRAMSASKLYRLERERLLEKYKALSTKGLSKEEADTLIEEMESFKKKHPGVMIGLGDQVQSVTHSKDAQVAYEIVFHTGLGRVLAMAFVEMNTQISWLLGWLMMSFIQQYVQTELINMSPNIGNAYAGAAGVAFTIYFFHKVLFTSANQYIQTRMGDNMSVFYESTPAWAKKTT
jgi:hypothetical protein